MEKFTEYYEFNNAEYYALIKVTSKYNLMFNAMKIYIKLIGGYDNLDHMRIEKAHPTKINEDEALLKFIKCEPHQDMRVREVIQVFKSADNSVLIVDESLL